MPETKIESLISALKSGSKEDAEIAIEKVKDFPDVESLPVLIANLSNRFWTVRKRSADILKGKGKVVIPMLASALKDDNPDVIFWSMKILGEMKEKEGRDLLLENLTSSDPNRRGWACEAIGNYNDPNVIKALIERFADESWPVRKKAAQSLARIGEDATPMLTEASKSPNEDISYWADRTLDNIQAIKERLVTIYT